MSQMPGSPMGGWNPYEERPGSARRNPYYPGPATPSPSTDVKGYGSAPPPLTGGPSYAPQSPAAPQSQADMLGLGYQANVLGNGAAPSPLSPVPGSGVNTGINGNNMPQPPKPMPSPLSPVGGLSPVLGGGANPGPNGGGVAGPTQIPGSAFRRKPQMGGGVRRGSGGGYGGGFSY